MYWVHVVIIFSFLSLSFYAPQAIIDSSPQPCHHQPAVVSGRIQPGRSTGPRRIPLLRPRPPLQRVPPRPHSCTRRPPPVRHLLTALSYLLPSAPLIPSSATSSTKQYRCPVKRAESDADKLCVSRAKLRVASAAACVNIAAETRGGVPISVHGGGGGRGSGQCGERGVDGEEWE